MYQLCPPTHCLSVSTTALAGAWLSVDHRASLWCNQIVRVLTGAISALAVRGRAGWQWEARQPAKMEAIRRRLLPGTHMLQALSLTAPHQAQQPVPPPYAEDAGRAEVPLWDAWNLESWKVRMLPHDSLSKHASAVHGDGADGGGGDGGGGGGGTSSSASGKLGEENENYLRIPAVEEETVYVWRVGGVASGDGYGASLVVVSSMELHSRNWRLVLCGPEVDTLTLQHSDASDLAQACLKPGGRAQDVSARAVELKGGGCHARWNADCVPSEPAVGGVRWVLSVGAHELRPLQVLCVVGPRKTRAAGGRTPDGTRWLAALRLVPPASTHDMHLPAVALFSRSWRAVDQERRGAWYLPMASLPGSLYPVPASMVIEHEDSSACTPGMEGGEGAGGGGDDGGVGRGGRGRRPLFKPMVVQTSEQPWQDSIGEGWARAEVQVGDPVQVWRQQRRSSWLSHPAPAAVVIIADPHCHYKVGIRGDVWAALGLGLRRHIARLIPLAAAALCLRRVFVRTRAAGEEWARGEPCLASVMTALWLLVLLHPVLVCVIW